MAYATPNTYVHLDTVTHTKLNILQANIADILARQNGTSMFSGGPTDENFMQHNARWLVYSVATGNSATTELRPILATDFSLSLPDPKNEAPGYIDLEKQAPWLAPGMIYLVKNCLYSFEAEII